MNDDRHDVGCIACGAELLDGRVQHEKDCDAIPDADAIAAADELVGKPIDSATSRAFRGAT